MYVRLAFAVAAHLEPEILIVDEVLAVGDAQFQKKCLGKLQSVSQSEGRTVLFVSHNLSVMRELCHTGLLLVAGRARQSGIFDDVAGHYLSFMARRSEYRAETPPKGDPQPTAWFERLAIVDAKGQSISHLPAGQSAWLELNAVTRCDLRQVQIAVRVSTQEGVAVFTTANTDGTGQASVLQNGRHAYRVPLPEWLAPGFYSITAAIHEPRRQTHAVLPDAIQFEITPGASPACALQDDRRGLVEPIIPWQILSPSP
jgi:lipopolysaccharide transport system ATP-binding protein